MSDSDTPKKVPVDVNVKPKLVGKAAFKNSLGDLAGELAEPGLILAAGGTAAQAAWGGLRGILLSRVLGPLGLISGAVIGIGYAIKTVVGQTRLLADGLKEARNMETMTTQFAPLLGGIQAARTRLAELFKFAETTPFSIKGIAESSRLLEIMTNGALATSQGLRMIGDSAAIAGRPLEEVSFWIGRLYDGMKSGAPTGEAMMRLQEMGVVSGSLRREIEQLTEAGAGTRSMWALVEKQLQRNAGGMDLLSQNADGLTSTLQDARDAMARGFGNQFLEREKDGIKAAIDVTEAFTPVIQELGSYLKDLGVMGDFTNKLKQNKAIMGAAATAASLAMKAFIGFGTAVIFAQSALVFKGINKGIRDFGSLSGAIKNATGRMVASVTGAKSLEAAMAGSTIRAKALTGALNVVKGAANLVGSAFKASFAALATPLGAVVGLIGMAAGASYLWYKSSKKNADALRDLATAQKELREEAVKNIANVKTLEEKLSLEEEMIASLAKAYRDLADAKASGKKNLIAQAEQGVVEAQGSLGETQDIDVQKRESDKQNLIERIELERRMADIVFNAQMQRANGEEKSLLMAQKREELEKRIAAATTTKQEADDADLVTSTRSNAIDLLNAELQRAIDEAPVKPSQTISASGNLGIGKSDLVSNEDRKASEAEYAAGQAAIKVIRDKIAALEALNTAETNAEAARAFDPDYIKRQRDVSQLIELQSELEEAKKAQKAFNEEAERSRRSAAGQAQIDENTSKLAEAVANGDSAAADNLIKRIRAAEDLLFMEKRIHELKQMPNTSEADAERIAQKELDARNRNKEASQAEYRHNQELEIRANEARANGRNQEARGIEDAEGLRQLTFKNITEGDMNPEDAFAMAKRELFASIGAEERASGAIIVADQFQRLGLGGNAIGSDPAQRARDRTNNLLKEVNRTLKEMKDEGGPL